MRLAPLLLLSVAACSSSSCSSSSGTSHATSPTTQPVGSGGGERTVLFPGGEKRFEGPSFKNACAGDADCKVGGCSSEICTAEEGVNSACIVYPDQPKGASCGCVKGECVWFRTEGASAPSAPATDAGGGGGGGGGGGAAQGMPCPDGKCAAGLSCVTYYGIAGPRGPAFTSCEIRCGLAGAKCPDGQKCITIADGPGQVCRPPLQ